MSDTNTINFYDLMAERGLVSQCTDSDDAIRKRLSQPIAAYCGFDPTADSLHVGSLVPIMGLAHLQRCGHKPIVLVGGATGLVGDPSGKSEARKMLNEATIRSNAEAIAKQIGRIVTFGDGEAEAVLVNNIDWIGPLSWLEVLRDIGSKVSVNRMVTMESVKQRMNAEGDGISYLEFSYMLLQAYDFAHLHKTYGCTLQIGGQDQWGNIVMGSELIQKTASVNKTVNAETIRKVFFDQTEKTQWQPLAEMWLAGDDFETVAERNNLSTESLLEMRRQFMSKFSVQFETPVAGLTFPLVTKADGGKFGKSEAGNIWLDAARTSPFEFFQFWRNIADADVGRYLGYFTFLPMDEVNQLAAAEGAAINESKVRLAFEVTQLIHGQEAAIAARDSAGKAFSSAADVSGDSIPHADLSSDELNGDLTVVAAIVKAGFAKSNGEARRLVQGGGVKLHDEKISDPQRVMTADDVQDGYVLLRVGKKRMFRFDVG